MLSMRRISEALAVAAALSICAPAGAAITTTNYAVTGVGSGIFSVNYDGLAYSLGASNYTLGSTTFTTSNAGVQPLSFFTLIFGGSVFGVNGVSVAAGQDDFFFGFDPTLNSQTAGIQYFIAGGGQGILSGQVTITQTETPPTGGVPEPSTWAMMLLGFAAIGLAMRRRRVAAPA